MASIKRFVFVLDGDFRPGENMWVAMTIFVTRASVARAVPGVAVLSNCQLSTGYRATTRQIYEAAVDLGSGIART